MKRKPPTPKTRKPQLEEYRPGPRHHPGWTRTTSSDRSGLSVRVLGLTGIAFSDLYHSLISITWRVFFSYVFLWYLSANLIFGSIYFLFGASHFDGLKSTQGFALFLEMFFFSVQTLATIGYGRISPSGVGVNFVVTAEALYGLLSVAVITGLLFARFSRPKSRLQFSSVALITVMDGMPHLTFRVSNERANHVVEAKITVSALVTEVTSEGQRFRNWHDLKLERDRTPLLSLTWLVVHPIDDKSPLQGLTHEQLIEKDIQVWVSVSGVDDNLGQMIYSRFVYRPNELVFDAQFVDMIEITEGRVVVDRSKLSEYTLA